MFLSMQQCRQALLITLFSVSTFLLALTLSWFVLAKMNFLYGVFHDYTSIGAGIDTYGPQNRYKQGFGQTTRAERLRLFSEINKAVHHHGLGLDDIRYTTPALVSRPILLREPEILHLQDVAILIDRLKVVVWVNVIIWCVFMALGMKQKMSITWRRQILGFTYVLAFMVIGILLLGPVDIFNQLHIWIFPKNHQWFFYYQDSLMSTLMMAPSLFGWIAVSLVFLAVLFFVLLLFVITRIIKF